ncbi:hypothetical protein PIROE2DRAFT_3131, partial [Piromyces sp. E2]
MSDTENRIDEEEGNFNEPIEDNFNLDNNGHVTETIIEESNVQDTPNGEGGENDNEEGNIKNEEEEEEDGEKKKKKYKENENDDDGVKKKVFQNVYYNINELKPKMEPKQVAEKLTEIVYIFGFESEKLNNLYFLNDTSVISAIGNYVFIVDINTLEHKYIPGIKNGGIGAIA